MYTYSCNSVWGVLAGLLLVLGSESYGANGLRCSHCHKTSGPTGEHVCDKNQDGLSVECIEPDQRCMIRLVPHENVNGIVKKCEFPPASAIIGTCTPASTGGSECFCKTNDCNKDEIDGVGAKSSLNRSSPTTTSSKVFTWLLALCLVVFVTACQNDVMG